MQLIMNRHFYLDVSLQLSEQHEPILPVYFKGSILQSLTSVFGEIGGQIEVDVLKFNKDTGRGIIRVPVDRYVRVRGALALISSFQDITCRFTVHKATPVLFSLVASHTEFD